MKNLLATAAALVLTLTSVPMASAEEKNGLMVNVTKRTLSRSDRRDSIYYTLYNRTQGYKMAIKNTSLRPMPEAEVTWTILVRKANYSDRTEKYTGTEKLKALRSSETMDVMFGAVPISGYRYERDYKDEMDYEVTVVHAGKETIRMSSMPNFAAVARRAILMESEREEGAGTRERGGNAADAGNTPPAVTPTVPAIPATGVRPVVPATPGYPMTPGTPVAPATPATPYVPATPTTPAPATATPVAPTPATSPDGKPFDFFNLNKKAPDAK